MAAARRLYPQLYATICASSTAPALLQSTSSVIPFRRALQSTFQTSVVIPAAIRIGLIPSILAGLWEGILRAVPKKKTSHRKTRQRFMAGKAMQDFTALNKCSACGAVKRAHLLCPACIEGKPRVLPAVDSRA